MFYDLRASLSHVLYQHDLDALIVPTNCAWSIAALAGYPIITVPAGFSSPNAELVSNKRGTYNTSGPNKPYGYEKCLDSCTGLIQLGSIAFIGRRFSEEKLIGLAYAFEQATQVNQIVNSVIALMRDGTDPTEGTTFASLYSLDAIERWHDPAVSYKGVAYMMHGEAVDHDKEQEYEVKVYERGYNINNLG